ncbi:hypothetical protein BU26DRAFT_551505 [Trematosphaeria pertusa]|uniref:Uncharacterized protein n=1 Tax=Trematosphaeria pertusa TaxID=390896 RepID=A0A6A6IDJ0_9PLEO|nr:uncharacterized protein BU26DRAFT_551505 [Trematosphaeria pertusa]KAF2248128.1 hypothetical protein BU26DRAFT_551505 [Trematosphaeria pertusa]
MIRRLEFSLVPSATFTASFYAASRPHFEYCCLLGSQPTPVLTPQLRPFYTCNLLSIGILPPNHLSSACPLAFFDWLRTTPMSGLESVASVATVLDVIITLGKVLRRAKNATGELNSYINGLKTLHSISSAVDLATKSIEGLENFTIADGGKEKGLLEFCNEHLAKVIKEADTTLLKKYGQDDISLFEKLKRQIRFSLDQEPIQGLIQSVEHAKSTLQTALSMAVLCRDESRPQKLQDNIRDMTRQSLDDHQGVGDNMKDTLRDHAQRMEKYFIQQKGQFQQSFQQYRNELGEHAKNLQESCERNCAISMKLEKRSFQTNSIISSLEESKSQGAEAISDVGLPTSPGRGALPADHASWLSRNGIPDDSPEEGISIPINTSASQDTSDALCGLCSARLETKNSGDDVDIAASENDQDPDSFEKAFANLISESYFNLSDDTDTDSLDFWEANSSEEDSESDSSSPSVSRLGILELPERRSSITLGSSPDMSGSIAGKESKD